MYRSPPRNKSERQLDLVEECQKVVDINDFREKEVDIVEEFCSYNMTMLSILNSDKLTDEQKKELGQIGYKLLKLARVDNDK